jgi:LPS-assembly protein
VLDFRRSSKQARDRRRKRAIGLAKSSVWATAFAVSVATSTGIAETPTEFQGSFMVADEMQYDPATETLEARGNIEIYNEGRRLTASSVVYQGAEGRVSVVGPLTIQDTTNGTRTFADFADLSTDMQDFVLISARHLMQDQLQLASAEMERTEGRFTEWRLVTASYCQVCENRPTPLWEIRAQRATHDQQERMIYLRNAQFRVAGVPVGYVPYLRMPDPTVERANGLLRASIRSSSVSGTTLRLPYFITLGDHADVTLTPNFTLGGGTGVLNTLEGRYRQSFAYGDIELNGAVTRQGPNSRGARAYLFGNGEFSFPSGFDLTFQLQDASHRTYLTDQNFFGGSTETFTGTPLRFDAAVLVSSLSVNRTRENEIVSFSGRWLDTLQPPNVPVDHPSADLNGEYTRWFEVNGIPGEFLFSTALQAEYNEFGPTNARQRDIERLFTGLRWRESRDIGAGFVLDGELAAFSDYYQISDDPSFAQEQSTTHRLAVMAIRWPWEGTMANGTRHTFEPFVRQIAFRGAGAVVPRVDGTLDEFDPNNRFALDRFRWLERPRDVDSTEIGFDYDLFFTNGWSVGTRIERDFLWNVPAGAYDGGPLYTARLGYSVAGLTMTGSQSFNSGFEPVRRTAALSYDWAEGQLGATYTRSEIDQDLGTSRITELLSANLSWTVLDGLTLLSDLTRDRSSTDTSFAAGGFNFDDGEFWSSSLLTNYSIDDAEVDTHAFSLARELDWGGTARVTYDFDRDTQRAIGLGLDYVNECVSLQSEILRRQSVIQDAQPALELTISVEFGGFSPRQGRRCG